MHSINVDDRAFHTTSVQLSWLKIENSKRAGTADAPFLHKVKWGVLGAAMSRIIFFVCSLELP